MFDIRVCVVQCHIGNKSSIFNSADAEFRCKHDERFTEIDLFTTACGDNSFVQYLEKLIKDAWMRFLDFVKYDNRKRVFFDSIGKFTAHVRTDITWRCSNQPMIGMFLGKIIHIESYASLFILEDKFCKCFYQLCLSGAGRSGEKHDTSRTSADFRSLHSIKSGYCAFNDVERFGYGCLLSFHPLTNDNIAIYNLRTTNSLPGIFCHPQLVTVYGFGEIVESYILNNA